jgi:hypothetical protein
LEIVLHSKYLFFLDGLKSTEKKKKKSSQKLGKSNKQLDKTTNKDQKWTTQICCKIRRKIKKVHTVRKHDTANQNHVK